MNYPFLKNFEILLYYNIYTIIIFIPLYYFDLLLQDIINYANQNNKNILFK